MFSAVPVNNAQVYWPSIGDSRPDKLGDSLERQANFKQFKHMVIMDLIKKKDELLEERTACEQAKQDAHNRIIEINKTLKKLENLIAEADEILGGLYPYPEEDKKEWPPKGADVAEFRFETNQPEN